MLNEMLSKELRESKSRLLSGPAPKQSGKSRLSRVWRSLFAGKKTFTIVILIVLGLIAFTNAQGITNTLGGNTATEKFIVENSDAEAGLVVTGEGNVGIGTSSPISKLHIYDDVNSSLSLRIQNANTGTGAATKLYFDGSNHAGISVFGPSFSGSENVMRIFNNRNSPDGSIDFVVNGGKKMVIDNTGNVGIGTPTPHSKLHVISTTTSGADNTAKFEATSIGSNASHIHYGTKGDWYIRSAASDGKVIIQDFGGNVGIGTNSPDATLHVEGTVKVGINGLVFSEIIELTGTTHAYSGQTSITYPTGYNSNNTRILTCEIKNSVNFWVSQGKYVGAGMDEQILISHPDESSFRNKPYRITLMKVE